MFIKTINMKIKEVMITPDKFAQVSPSDFFKVALDKMNHSKLGIACLVENTSLKGIITDGDLLQHKVLPVISPFIAQHASIRKGRRRFFVLNVGCVTN